MTGVQTSRARAAIPVRRPSQRALGLFSLYMRWYLRRHFHAVRVANLARLPSEAHPLILFVNHASWWDPLACMLLALSALPEREHYAPMEEAALRRYGLFQAMGFFPVENGRPRGAAQLLGAGMEILQRDRSVLWITPESRFQDVRQRPVVFRPGLGALMSRIGRMTCAPVAIEYTFWNERLPEILINIGEPLAIADGTLEEPRRWTSLLSHATASTLDELATLAAGRNPDPFVTLLSGKSGIGGIYGLWKRLGPALAARPYDADHDRALRRGKTVGTKPEREAW